MVTKREILVFKAEKLSEIYKDLAKDGDQSKANMRLGSLFAKLKSLKRKNNLIDMDDLLNNEEGLF